MNYNVQTETKEGEENKNMDIIKVLQQELQIGYQQAEAAVKLIDEGNTIPFIARYRKEVTGALDDEVLRSGAGTGDPPARYPAGVYHQLHPLGQ